MYATLEDLIDRFGEHELVSLCGNEDGVINQDTTEAALKDANELINSYLAAKYALPLSIAPSCLIRIAADLARYFLYTEVVPEAIEKQYEKDIAFLKDIAKGVVVLAVSQTGQNPQQSDEIVFHGSSPRLFSHKQMKGF